MKMEPFFFLYVFLFDFGIFLFVCRLVSFRMITVLELITRYIGLVLFETESCKSLDLLAGWGERCQGVPRSSATWLRVEVQSW